MGQAHPCWHQEPSTGYPDMRGPRMGTPLLRATMQPPTGSPRAEARGRGGLPALQCCQVLPAPAILGKSDAWTVQVGSREELGPLRGQERLLLS